MMVPVGRLVILRTAPRAELVRALAWLTIPALVGPMIGPPLGGFIATYFHWRYIFWINVPIGALGVLLTSRYIPDLREADVGAARHARRDALGLGALLSGVWSQHRRTWIRAPARRRGPDRRRRRRDFRLCATCASGARADPRSGSARHPDLSRRDPWRLSVSHRHWGHSVSVAAAVAGGLPFDGLSIGIADLRRGGGSDGDEDGGAADPARLQLSPRADRQCAGVVGVSGRQRLVHRGDAALDRHGRAAGRRLLPFARIHRAQRHRLRRDRSGAR